MTRTPQDIEVAARRIIERGGRCMIPWEASDAPVEFRSRWNLAGEIAKAILAERQRCARVARHLNGWGADRGQGGHAEHIAKVIERGPWS